MKSLVNLTIKEFETESGVLIITPSGKVCRIVFIVCVSFLFSWIRSNISFICLAIIIHSIVYIPVEIETVKKSKNEVSS